MSTAKLLGSLLLSIACAHAAADEPDVANLAWLAGCWDNPAAEPGSGEQWTAPAGGTMLGISRKVQNGATVELEFMQLRSLPDGKLAFIAQPSGQRATVFALLRISATEAVFENLQHDFPQRIVYAREGESKLRARVEGLRAGALEAIEFPMNRIDCDAQLRSGAPQ